MDSDTVDLVCFSRDMITHIPCLHMCHFPHPDLAQTLSPKENNWGFPKVLVCLLEGSPPKTGLGTRCTVLFLGLQSGQIYMYIYIIYIDTTKSNRWIYDPNQISQHRPNTSPLSVAEKWPSNGWVRYQSPTSQFRLAAQQVNSNIPRHFLFHYNIFLMKCHYINNSLDEQLQKFTFLGDEASFNHHFSW